jgi:hypothetical protein
VEKKRIFTLLAVAISLHTGAQQFGGNPPSLKWKQINSDTARVIFPAGLEKQAADVSSIVHKLAALTKTSIGERIGKINILLQNQPTSSNGYVALGPFRSEFFVTPHQNSFELGSLPWHKSLALHEYRHVQQFNNFRKGLAKGFYVLFGEEGQTLANNLSVPDWFWEGDAVYQETLFSEQGRGRLPYFFNDYRSLWSAGKNYSWMKLRNGSYRDLLPDHYQLGYMLVSFGYEKYGPEIWKKITNDAAGFRGLFYPFQKAVQRYTGQSFAEFRNDALEYFKKNGKADADDAPSRYARGQKHFAGHEQFPYWIDSSHVLIQKRDFKRIPSFYIRDINTGKEKKIKNRSISSDEYYSYNNGKIVYSAFQPDARWGWRSFEVLKVIDIGSGKEKQISRKTRYLSPDISRDGTKAIAVRADPSGRNEVHVISTSDGKLLSDVPNPANYVFTFPKYVSEEKFVSPVRNMQGEMALGLFDVVSGNAEWLTPFTYNVIGYPVVNNDTISFTMSEGSHDKLFVAATGKVFRFEPNIENRSTGNYQLSMTNGKYAWTSFTAAGTRLYTGSGTFREASISKEASNFYSLNSLEKSSDLVGDTTTKHYVVSGYPASFRLFNFHSWRPYISDPEYSYSLVSENILNTLQTELYFTYNRNENFKETGAQVSFAGWYPVINAGGAFTFDRSFTDSSKTITWNEFNALAGLSLPLAFTSGTFYQNLEVSGTLNTKQVFYTGNSKEQFPNKHFIYGEWSFLGTNQQLRARQNIYPRIAQTIFTRYRQILNKYTGNQLLISGAFYFPGIARNHNIVVQAAYQQRDTMQQYTFSNSFPFSRGYSNIDFPRMWKLGGNYHFPIVYPDWGFGNIIYLLRVRGNIFYDVSRIKSLRSGQTLDFRTAGSEIYFDTRWWNQLALSIGLRYNRLLDNEIVGLAPNQWEFVLPVNLLSR